MEKSYVHTRVRVEEPRRKFIWRVLEMEWEKSRFVYEQRTRRWNFHNNPELRTAVFITVCSALGTS